MFISGQVIGFAALFGNAMGVRGGIVQFGRALMIPVMRSVVITSGHG